MKKGILILLLACLRLAAYADGYWLDVRGTHQPGKPVTIRICYGGVTDSGTRYWKSGAELDKMAGFQVTVHNSQREKKMVTLTQKSNGWEGVFTPASAGCYRITAIDSSLPVVDRSATGGVSVKPVQYLCALYTAGNNKATDAKPLQLLDIIARQQGAVVEVQTFLNNNPAAAAKLRIFNPDNREQLPVTDSAGKAVFMAVQKGLYLIRFDWTDKKAGSYKGVSYSSIRHRCDYALWVE